MIRSPQSYRFGRFAVERRLQRLTHEGRIVPLKPKAYDLLCVLLANRERVMSKRELLDWLWPRQDVGEANLSQTVYELRRALGESAQSPRWIENVPRRGYRFVGEALVLDESARTGPPRSLAVLPFQALSDDPLCRALGLGIADSVILSLGGTGRVVVRPLSAVLPQATAGRDALTIGRELEVDAVLEGSVQRVGDRLRLSARLLRLPGGEDLWAEGYYADPSDLQAVHDKIATRVAEAVALRLTSDERRRMAPPPVPLEVQALHFKARYCWHRWTPDASRQAVDYLQQALNIDPDHAPSHAWLGAAWATLAIFGAVAPTVGFANARRATERAVALDERLAAGHEMAGAVQLFYDWDLAAAARSLDRAIELAPDSSNARHLRALVLAIGGHDAAALEEMMQALQADPSSLIANTDVGTIHYWARRYDAARAWFEGALRQDPHFVHARRSLAHALLELGQADAALHEIERGVDRQGQSPAALGELAHVLARAGRAEDARRILADLEARLGNELVDPYQIAFGHVGLRDWPQAFAWLDRALEHRSRDIVLLGVSPAFDPVRRDPRFTAVLSRAEPRRVGPPHSPLQLADSPGSMDRAVGSPGRPGTHG